MFDAVVGVQNCAYSFSSSHQQQTQFIMFIKIGCWCDVIHFKYLYHEHQQRVKGKIKCNLNSL